MKIFFTRIFWTCPLGLLFALNLNAQCPDLIWSDEFDGTSLDNTKWTIQTGDGCSIGLCGWGNNELQNYTADNIEVSEGTLKIIAKKLSFDAFTSGRIRSLGKGDWTYGRFEARMKLPTGRGLWPAFWMLSSTEPYGGWPQSGEIDIMELIGSEPATVHGTIHFGNAWPNNQFSGDTYTLQDGIFSDDFHEFAIEWEPNQIKWFIDDYLFATKTLSNTNPFMWPFDQNMYLLLNLAVGGNWPGFPNSTTPFPSQLEVDYVHVYSGSFPYLEGPRTVTHQAENQSYYIRNLSERASINWIVPEDATVLTGAGTSILTLSWGSKSGKLQAVISDDCLNDTLSVFVKVEAPYIKAFSFENFDEASILTYASSNGTYLDNIANPDTNEVNTTALCGKYQRNSSETFDVLRYDLNNSFDGVPFVMTEERFYIDIYTDAPIGTTILLQLENKNVANPNNYPKGRHSRFQARTEKQNEWHTLSLPFLDRPDGSVPHNAINQFLFLFGSNSSDGSTYYYDNFDSYKQDEAVTATLRSSTEDDLLVYPNPATDILWIHNQGNKIIDRISLYNTIGVKMYEQAVMVAGQLKNLQVENIPPGIYYLRYNLPGQDPGVKKLIIK